MTEQPKRLEHEQYYHQPHCNAPSHVKQFARGVSCSCRTPDITEQLPGREHAKECECGQCPEQPNSNAMIFEQVNGSVKVSFELLGQLKPKTGQVDNCITTLKSWQDNNLKHLQKAFE